MNNIEKEIELINEVLNKNQIVKNVLTERINLIDKEDKELLRKMAALIDKKRNTIRIKNIKFD